ncbi:MarR family transcriptional regulator [Curvibacter sp. APW13]|uniref:MarR family winged helix-turn-helix transcriptional regulator n=1 Tax=Curvibacter sp. APW13 TaxID=3077236 RepID=UPI0028DDF442|nr:MarR family transcriptional regulator [Curvibacter sp. APW13]MDT8992321.1 MarR family transcriptional regulator [Curvibacter sp. APW13]
MPKKPTPGAPPLATFYDPLNYTPEESVGFLMRQILSNVATQVEAELIHTELTNAQWVPLYKIYNRHASTVAELARVCHMDTGAMTRLLDRLEAKGLVQRQRSDSDRRVVNIALTPAGTEAAQAIPHALSAVQNRALAGFSADEFQQLKQLLRRVLVNARQAGKDDSE